MSIVFITETNGPLHSIQDTPACRAIAASKHAWADIDLEALDNAPHFYTLVDGAPVLLQADLDTFLAEEEQRWVKEEMVYVRDRLDEIADGDPRSRGTASVWRSYRTDLRNRVTGGVVVGESRPTRPT